MMVCMKDENMTSVFVFAVSQDCENLLKMVSNSKQIVFVLFSIAVR